MTSSGSYTKAMILILDYLLVGVCLGILYMAFSKNWSLSPEMIALVSSIATGAMAMIKDAHGFEFGSSRGSQAKDIALGASPPGQADRMASPMTTNPMTVSTDGGPKK